MCGIAGILHFETERPIDVNTLKRMTNVLTHRGPDGEGYYVDGNIGLGHRRLAVIDLEMGSQPMASRDKSTVIVFNGEIYNYVELKEELKTLGHEFGTSSDTEVMLHAYEEWGIECHKKFNGMWAFAIWDSRQKHLFLSRDRIGEKPLFYSLCNDSFLFGSEIKSILAFGHTYEPASQLLNVYLSLGYVPAPYTFYNGISKLMPGHFLLVKNRQVNEYVYWSLPLIDERDMRNDAKNIYKEFEACFSDSVRIRMRSDVPFGAFLSGGLDSSSIVAAMVEHSSAPIETFTIGFTERSFDERAFAKEVAEKFQTNHHERLKETEAFDKSLLNVLSHFDEPFGDASATNVGLVSELARQEVTVALTGDGGDEVLSGYTSYVTEELVRQYRKMPAFIRSIFSHSAHQASLMLRNEMRYWFNRLERFMYLCENSFEERLIAKLSLLDRDSIMHLIPASIPQMSLEDYFADVFAGCTFTDPFYRLMYFNLKVSLPDDMLAKVDRMSMAHSLETRVPFLDHRLVELTYSIHKKVKLVHYRRKNLLKQTYGKKLPASLLKAPKMSFNVPLREWFKQKEFEDRLNDLERSDMGLNHKVIAEIVRANKSGERDYGDFIWRLFVWKNWLTPIKGS